MFRAITAASLVAASLLTGQAGAEPLDDTRNLGGCALRSVQQDTLTGPEAWHGVVYGYAVGYALTRAHNPVTVVALRCELSIDGVVVGSWSRPGTGPVAVLEAHPVSYTRSESSWLRMCSYVDLVDAHGNATTRRDRCGLTTLEIPPQAWFDAIDDAFFAARYATREPDFAACPVLLALGPDAPDPLRVEDDGDVYAGDEFLWDCPPYGAS
jgi:hypothetical protein